MPSSRRQPTLFKLPRGRSRKSLRLRRPVKLSPQCENMIGHSFIEEGKRIRLPATQCEHRGRRYQINQFARMVLCICCVQKLRKRAPNTIIKEVP